jgi:hypothetical protein
MKRIKKRAYSPSTLSESEKQRFLLALGDGFFAGHPSEVRSSDLPAEITPGLLHHPFYTFNVDLHDAEMVQIFDLAQVPAGWLQESGENKEDIPDASEPSGPPVSESDIVGVEYNATSPLGAIEDAAEEERAPDEVVAESAPMHDFWESGAFQVCPVHFNINAIRQYFGQQKEDFIRLSTRIVRNEYYDLLPDEEKERYVYMSALYKPYSKAWYEYHINTELSSTLKNDVAAAAVMGRLVEQYYWKFIHESAAIVGMSVQRGGVAGAALKASMHAPEHEKWKLEADAMLSRNPRASMTVVATHIRRKLKLGVTSKHIARVIKGRKHTK